MHEVIVIYDYVTVEQRQAELARPGCTSHQCVCTAPCSPVCLTTPLCISRSLVHDVARQVLCCCSFVHSSCSIILHVQLPCALLLYAAPTAEPRLLYCIAGKFDGEFNLADLWMTRCTVKLKSVKCLVCKCVCVCACADQ